VGPDVELLLDEVAIPLRVAMSLFVAEKVSVYSRRRLCRRIEKGFLSYPGVGGFFSGAAGCTFVVYEWLGGRLDCFVKDGCKVERHLEDGDVVLVNRQPSLHRLSVLGLRARIVRGRTVRISGVLCTPFNADFDGDEMNIHFVFDRAK
jgi:DNA-directed RNA polymerase beta' subunit